MENQVIQNRLQALREAMRAAGIDYYMIPTADFHNSEYVSDYFKVREYFCNFSGSNGTLVIWQGGPVDGRQILYPGGEGAGGYLGHPVPHAGGGRSDNHGIPGAEYEAGPDPGL